jgi:2-dehydro-3-deoxygluconokinase
MAPFLDVIGLALPTFEDEQALWGDKTPADTLARYTARGIEVCVKCGGDGCHLGSGGFVPVPQRIAPIDTTAAGDAFNAAYLTARLTGHPPVEAAHAGHILAGTVIQHRGAIMPKDAIIPAFAGRGAR